MGIKLSADDGRSSSPKVFVVGRGFAVAATGLIHSVAHIQGDGQFKLLPVGH